MLGLPQKYSRNGLLGQSIVEISLITPLVLVALYIPADFGIAFYTAHLTQNAVREAARIGVSTKDPFNAGEVADEAFTRLPSRLSSPTVTVRFFGGSNCMQNVSVTAQGSYTYFFYQMMRLLGVSVPNTTSIMRTSQMRYEFQPYTYSNPCLTQSAQAIRS
jgi:Flp pilus assembly protein TadG